MIDYIKLKISNPNFKELLNNDLLNFNVLVNNKTDEISKYIGYYKNLKFELFEPTPKNPNRILFISGSLHKYYNNGKHNYNRFTKKDFLRVVKDLQNKFDLQPEKCIITSLETGLNIMPPIPTKELLNYCLMHRKSPFKHIFTKDEGNYIQTKKQRHIIKIYDKMTHYKRYNLPNEIMRFELKFLKMIDLHKKGIYNLQDLINFDFNIFKNQLLKVWNEILFYEPDIWRNTPFEYKYNNPIFWKNLKKNNYKYHLKKVKAKSINGIKKQINDLLENTKI